jgi:hypothetical protein
MDRGEFWKIIETSRKKAKGDPDAQLDILRGEVSRLPTEEVVSFGHHFDTLRCDAYRWDLWGAAYVIGGGCSDDGFTDFRSWLVVQGPKIYDDALKDPDSLLKVVDEDLDGQIEGFQYIASEVWEEKTGKDASEYPPYDGEWPAEPAGQG